MSYTALKYHIVFATKQRRAWLSTDRLPRLVEYIGGLVRRRNGKLLAANGPADHIHLLASIPAALALAEFIRDVKSLSSGWIHETFVDMAGFAWQDGYAGFTVSQSGVEDVRRYILAQQEHHRTMTFEEELIALLRRHEIDFDERYIAT